LRAFHHDKWPRTLVLWFVLNPDELGLLVALGNRAKFGGRERIELLETNKGDVGDALLLNF
jgi:hypothetical protein